MRQVGWSAIFWATAACGRAEAPPSVPDDATAAVRQVEAPVFAVPLDDSPVDGPPTAAVTIVVATGFTDAPAASMRGALAKLRAAYGDELRIVHKHHLVVPDAEAPARAACAAHRQGRYAAMADVLWTLRYPQTDAQLIDQAVALGLERDRFAADLRGVACDTELARDRGLFAMLGVDGSPTYFVNGRALEGANEGRLRVMIEAARTEARAAYAAGVAPDAYYDQIVRGGVRRR